MRLSTWLFFSATEAILCLTPGPAVLFVVACGLAQGGRTSLWANAGILTGNAFYFVLSALGLGAVLLASNEVFTAIKYLGAAYLVYLGVRTTFGAGLGVHAAAIANTHPKDSQTLVRGFALQAANPKALIFFAALLPQFIDARRAIGPQVLILGLTSVIIEFFVLAAYGYLAARAAAIARQPRFVKVTNRVSGGMLVAAGAGIAFSTDR